MANLSLRALLSAKSGAGGALAPLMAALEGPLSIEDGAGNVLLGLAGNGASRVPVMHCDAALGWVGGPQASAEALGLLLAFLAAKEAERRSLGAEVLHLYREIHLIEQLSEQLAALLDVEAVGNSGLAQARRLIAVSSGGVLISEKSGQPMYYTATFGDQSALPEPGSAYAASMLDRGVAEIVDLGEMSGAGSNLRSLIFAPLRAKQHTVGVIVLVNDSGDSYTAPDLKLLNTIALQTAAGIENALANRELLEREVERQALKRYLPSKVADLILASGGAAQLTGELQPVTVLYVDIRGFAAMSEPMDARETVAMLREFFSVMSTAILECNGTLDKFIGDCIMALFGAPVKSEEAARDGLRAAVLMQQRMRTLNQQRSKNNAPPIQIGIGLHHGLAVVGNIGSEDRVQYTAIGDTVNVASRLVNNAGASQILVSEDVRAELSDHEGFEPLGEVELKGRAGKINVYSVRWQGSELD